MIDGIRVPNEYRFSEEYKAYLKSPRWNRLRAQLIKLRGGCEKCGKASNLQVHHVTYERLGREKLTDLEVLCYDCHRKADIERQKKAIAQRHERYWNARLDGWASKVYGENWADYHDPQDVEEEFHDWLERKGDDW